MHDFCATAKKYCFLVSSLVISIGCIVIRFSFVGYILFHYFHFPLKLITLFRAPLVFFHTMVYVVSVMHGIHENAPTHLSASFVWQW